jgi:hypothetical protein
VVDLGKFGCIHGGDLRKLPNSLMRCIGQIVAMKWVVNFVHATFERMGVVPRCFVP